MTNPEYSPPPDDIELALEREELIDHYLDQRDTSYEELIAQLERHGGEIAFHDSEQLAQLCYSFSAGVGVEFSELQLPGDYQPGAITRDSFLVPLANRDRQATLYLPYLCTTIQDAHGVVDVTLFPIAKRSNDRLGVSGLRILFDTNQV